MSNLPATIDTDDLATIPTAGIVALLAKWEALLADSTAIAAAEARDKARTIREVAKMRKMAGEISIAANRVEAHALRRIGQLGVEASHLIPAVARTAARWLGALPQPAFDAFINRVAITPTIVGMVQIARSQEARDIEQGEAHTRARENSWHRTRRGAAVDEMRTACRAIIHEIFTEGHPVTVSHGAKMLLDLLNTWQDDYTSAAAETIVAKAMERYKVAPPMGGWENLIGLEAVPPFILVHTDEGWVRVARDQATVAQLRAMAVSRLELVEQLRGDAENLLVDAEDLRLICDEYGFDPETTKLQEAATAATRAGRRNHRRAGETVPESAKRILAEIQENE